MEKIEGITNKQFLAIVAIMILIAITSICIVNYITNKKVIHTAIDSADFKLMKSSIEKKFIKDKINMHDSIDKRLIKIDTVYVDRWHKAKVLAIMAPDTCNEYIKRLINACDSMKSVKDSINKNLRDKINEQQQLSLKDSADIVLFYQEKAKADSTIFALKNQLAIAIKQKKMWRNSSLAQSIYIILREGKSVLLN